MRVSDLFESRSAPLYHFMDHEKTLDVFDKDAMPGLWTHTIPGIGALSGNSMTRNSHPKLMDHRMVKLTFNQEALASRYRIIPLDGETIFRHTGQYSGGDFTKPTMRDRIMNKSRYTLAEEFVIGDIKPLHKYLTHVSVRNPNFQIVSGYNAVAVYESTIQYCEKFSIPYDLTPDFIENIEEIKQRWAEEEEEDELVEAAPTDAIKAGRYFHGTGNTASAEAIMREGLKGRETQGRGQLAPVAGRVYLTPRIDYALMYALGGNYTHAMKEDAGDFRGASDPYGYIFVVDGKGLGDVQPDEDEVGQFLSDHAQLISGSQFNRNNRSFRYADSSDVAGGQIWNYIRQGVTPNQFNQIMDGMYSYFAAGGKRVLKNMPDWMKVELINRGCHFSSDGVLRPSECWRILKTDLSKLKKDGSNFFDIATRVA